MKNIKYLAMVALVALSLSSCDKDTEGLTDITYYPVITLNGGDVILKLGENYVDPGYSADLNGEDVTSQVVVTNNIDNTTFGSYKVNYSVKNSDGFSATESRNVFVCNPGHIDNLYFGESQYGSRHYYNAPIKVLDNGDGTYTVDDILGGFYCYGRYPGYLGVYDFFADAVIHLDGDNVILDEVGSWYFDAYPISIVEGKYDAEAETFTFDLDFDGDPFYVQLVGVR